MVHTRSQEGLEEEPEAVVTSSTHEPMVITGVPPWIASLLIAVGLIIAAVLLSRAIGGDVQLGPEPELTIGAQDPEAAAPPPAATPAPAPALAGTLVAGDAPLLPIPADGLAPYQDRTVRGDGVPVYSVVADEGFWVGTSDVDRIYVVYQTGGFESPPDVDPGDLVSFIGRLEPVDPAVPTQFRLTEAEGLGYLRAQGFWISTASVDIPQPAP